MAPAHSAGPGRRPVVDLVLIAVCLGLAWLIIAGAAGERRPTLAADPLDVVALRTLGLDLDRSGRTAAADAVMSFAGGRSWRDGPTQAWLLRRRLRQGRYAEAMAHADALLRRDPAEAFWHGMFRFLDAAAGQDETRPALVDRLAAKPPWRIGFLEQLAPNGGLAAAGAVLTGLEAGDAPPTADEIAPYLDRLVAAGDYRGALLAWTAWARPGQDPAGLLLRDGQFADTPGPGPFAWRGAEGVGGSSVVLPGPPGVPGRALAVDYDGVSTPSLPGQLLVLAPGRYRLTWLQQASAGAPDRLAWTVRCADGSGVLARAAARSTGEGWRAAAMTFAVPAAGCQGQWLELLATPGERRDPASVRYAHFALAREP